MLNIDIPIATALFQSSNELANLLRGGLNTSDFSQLDAEKFTSKLQAFKQIIETILEDNKGFKVVDEYFIKEAHLRIFSQALNSILPDRYSHLNPNETIQASILQANLISKLSLKELYGVEL